MVVNIEDVVIRIRHKPTCGWREMIPQVGQELRVVDQLRIVHNTPACCDGMIFCGVEELFDKRCFCFGGDDSTGRCWGR